MKTLALDLASRTGWALGGSGAVLCSGHWLIAPTRNESPGMRYIKLRAHLNRMREAHPDLRLVAFELPARFRSGAATAYAHGCVAIVESWAAECNIEHVGVNPTTLKRHATGKGNVEKKQMFEAAKRKWPSVANDDEADALWVLEYVMEGMR